MKPEQGQNPQNGSSKLIGTLCTLDVFDASNLEKLRSYLTNQNVVRYVSTLGGDRLERFLSWLQRHSKVPGSGYAFSIFQNNPDGDRFVGISSLHFCGLDRRTAISGTIVGESALWGAGIGLESAVLKLEYAFGTLGIERILATLLSDNERAKRLVDRLGYEATNSPNECFSEPHGHGRLFYELTRDNWLRSTVKRSKSRGY